MAVEWNPERYQRTMDWVQENLDVKNAALPAEFKERFPIRTCREIEAEFPNRWLAILATRVDELVSVCEGRLLATAQSRRAVEALVAPLLAELPGRVAFTYFNNRPGSSTGRARRTSHRASTPVTV
jgi:hypothetical protein